MGWVIACTFDVGPEKVASGLLFDVFGGQRLSAEETSKIITDYTYTYRGSLGAERKKKDPQFNLSYSCRKVREKA